MAEIVEGHIIASGYRRSTSANGAQFSRRGCSFRNPTEKVAAQSLTHEFGSGAVLASAHAIQLFKHRGW